MVLDGKVAATYRHSYHKSQVPVLVYEKTMTALFRHYHGLTYDKAYISTFVKEHLTKAPASLDAPQRNLFFMQHAALECIYHLKLETDANLIVPFLNDSGNFHNRVSGARAMIGSNTTKGKLALLKTLQDSTADNFVKVMCIRTLIAFSAHELKPQLQKLVGNASDEGESFGGDIMDPRVCTSLPSVKQSLNELLSKL